jgi:hypothetical protein
MANWHLMMSERFRRVLKIHPEFEKLTDRDQVSFAPIKFHINSKKLISFTLIKINFTISKTIQLFGSVHILSVSQIRAS